MKKLTLAVVAGAFAFGAHAGGMDDAEMMDDMSKPMMMEPEVEAPDEGGGMLLLLLLAVLAALALEN